MLRFAFMLLVSAPLVALAQKPSPEIMDFLTSFEKAAEDHNRDVLMDHFDKTYKDEQHDAFLGGNTEQFLNEFFCGTLKGGDAFVCPGYMCISGLKLKKAVKKGDGYTLTYLIQTTSGTIKTSWFLQIDYRGKAPRYGMVGAMG
jgi:hypothetical protein